MTEKSEEFPKLVQKEKARRKEKRFPKSEEFPKLPKKAKRKFSTEIRRADRPREQGDLISVTRSWPSQVRSDHDADLVTRSTKVNRLSQD